ncbi:Glutamate synthase [NADPH] small chain [Aquisphaera giovannonii]|uniref:Glutamate synthase [NADPH] small chain n=1 Tax=Aquisphaera giovannonii TaxID=406548 RepID=A0A5B9W1Z8_9BACT|nr:glutamate synthase subunit beta [Aquisphaera giovannonii]QEH34025.1 Glutamate synthase [NADPH] small chain [Aquisphaera giovannonii]
MGKPTGFMEYPRELPTRRPVDARLHDYLEVYEPFPEDKLRAQGARCMDCGIPFCHQGCPLGNLIPDWNDLVYKDHWRAAIDRLHATNNFPEFTGRLCPAPCEASCVLGINNDPVAIKQVELAIIEHAWEQGWVAPEPPKVKTGKSVAVVGSGPAGLAAAQQLARAGHSVTVFERADRIGGLLRYGIPDFKMEKRFLDRRLRQMELEGVTFRPGVDVGADVTAGQILAEFDAVCLCGGATQPRDLPIEGRNLDGILFAMDFLTAQNRRVAGLGDGDGRHEHVHTAEGKHVIIIGGGDTGADCLGTSHRHRCKSVHQFEIVPRPPESRTPANPWPQWSNVFRVSSAHEEGGERVYSINTRRFVGEGGRVKALEAIEVEMKLEDGRPRFVEIPGTEKVYPADLVLLAMGFTGPERNALLEQFGVELDPMGNVKADATKRTSVPKVFTAGDMTRGQSLIVWAIAEGRHAAHSIDEFLMGSTLLPAPLDFGNHARPFS